MLAYRNIILTVLIGSLLIFAICWATSYLDIWLVLILVILNFGVIIAGSFIVCSGLYLKVLCSGKLSEKKIVLSFDDGPNSTITPKVLDLLEEFEVKATFFLIGKNIRGNEQLVKRIVDEGHLIGNHSFSHSRFFGFLSTKKILRELEETNQLIEEIVGMKSSIFRPPFGVTNPNIAKAVRTLDYTAIGWNIRSLDGVKKNNTRTILRVLKRLRPGGIILFHDTHREIIEILDTVIQKAQKEGYEFVPLNELINIKTTL